MKHNISILLAISCLVGGMMVGLSLDAYGQTSDLIQLDDSNHYGQFSIDNVHVSEKEYYKLVFMNVHVKVKDLALEDNAEVFLDSITLSNENGKTYQPKKNADADCNDKGWDGHTFIELHYVSGSEGGIGQHSLCYMVEKEFNNFKVYYNIPYYNIHNTGNPYPSFQIGSIDLTNINGQIPTPSSSLSNSNPSASSISQSTANIFEQLMNFLKQLFSQVGKSTTQSLAPSERLTATPNTIYTEDNYYAQLVPSDIQVIDKGGYKVISFTVDANVQDLPIEGNVNFEDLYTTLQDQNSKIYQPDKTECTLNDLIPIIGKQSSSARYTVCYSIDKTFNKFSIWYTEPPNNYHTYRIGYLSTDSDLFSKYVAHYSSQPIQIGMIDLTK